MPYSTSFKLKNKLIFEISGQRRPATVLSLSFNFCAQYMAFSENYKELLMYFSCFYRKYAHKHKKNAANNSRIIFLPNICNVLLRNFKSYDYGNRSWFHQS